MRLRRPNRLHVNGSEHHQYGGHCGEVQHMLRSLSALVLSVALCDCVHVSFTGFTGDNFDSGLLFCMQIRDFFLPSVPMHENTEDPPASANISDALNFSEYLLKQPLHYICSPILEKSSWHSL